MAESRRRRRRRRGRERGRSGGRTLVCRMSCSHEARLRSELFSSFVETLALVAYPPPLAGSVAVDPRERPKINALLEATDQRNARLVRTMTEGGANPDAVVDNARPQQARRRDGRNWAKVDGWSGTRVYSSVLPQVPEVILLIRGYP